MALTKTSLSAALTASALELKVASATGATVGGIVKIEDEYAVITSVTGTVIGVRSRGDEGTTAVAHNSGAAVIFGLKSDLPIAAPHINPPRDIKYYSAAGAIALPTDRDAVAVIGVGASGAHAMTLADPPAVASGLELFIVSDSAYAHTVTLATGYGGSNATDVFTFSGAKGDSITLKALNGTWAHKSTGLVAADTVSATVA